jgi:hypothetical protein
MAALDESRLGGGWLGICNVGHCLVLRVFFSLQINDQSLGAMAPSYRNVGWGHLPRPSRFPA